MSFNIKLRHLENENLHLLYGEPLIFHCNHFNLFLQRTIEDAGDYIPSEKILTDGATSVVWQMFQRLFEVNQHIREPKDRLKVASKIYSYLGFGLLEGLQTIAEKGGSFQTPITHYTYGWVNKWGKRTKPVDYFTCGYIQAAMAIAYYKKPSYYQVEQAQCLTMGHSINEFSIRYSKDNSICPISPGRGVTIKDYQSRKAIPTNINEKLIVDTLSSMPIVGNSEGMIPAFGVFLTRHFANYYNYIVYETEQAIKNAIGDESLAANLFIEAGHVCAFSTFGGIMKSDEWYGLVYPQIKTREDWISGIIAVVNSLGWGIWSVKELIPEKKLVIEAFGDYESNAYLSCYGTSSIPKSYLVTGGAAGLMNLMYHLDITTKPILDEETYSKLFQTPGFFEGKQIKCRTMGDDRCEIVVEREG